VTLHPPKSHFHVDKLHEMIEEELSEIVRTNKFIVGVGGDHSITTPHYRTLKRKFGELSVIQIDAHADLREEYEGSLFSHACVMARIREHTTQTLQLGIRSLSREEAERVESEQIDLVTMHAFRNGADWKTLLEKLPDPVFITIDVDAFDWSVIASTGTPEPGGLLWHEALDLFDTIFATRNVVGFDAVELSYAQHDRNSPVAVAKLIYHLIGLKLKYHLAKTGADWPIAPVGPLFEYQEHGAG
jgi:agmatinase